MSVGVIVGRFQVAAPHPGHFALIEQVQRKHQKILICLGVGPTRLSATDPLDYAARERMMRSHFPSATITPVYDSPSDERWSQQLDLTVARLFPVDPATLYGSRSSFLPRYHGKLPTRELEELALVSGSELRRMIRDEVRDSEDWRGGIIYACMNRYPISYQAVDVAIIKGAFADSGSMLVDVLLCQKAEHPGVHWFIGGFVDPKDGSLEEAVKREIVEETGVEVGEPRYLGSDRIPDWRYRGREDQIMSALFVAKYLFGAPKANDDIVAVEWVPMLTLPNHLAPPHRALAAKLVEYLKGYVKGEL